MPGSRDWIPCFCHPASVSFQAVPYPKSYELEIAMKSISLQFRFEEVRTQLLLLLLCNCTIRSLVDYSLENKLSQSHHRRKSIRATI